MGIFDSLRNLFGGNQSQGQGNIFSLDGLREWNDRIYNQQQGHTFGGEKYLKNYDEINRNQLHRIHQNIMSYQNGWFSQGQNSILGGQQVSSLTSSSIFPKKQQPTTSIIQSVPSGKQPIALLTASPTAPSISVGGQQNFNSTYEQDLSFPETRSWTGGAQNSIEKANRVFSTKWYQNDSAVEAGGPLKTYEQSKAPTSGPFSLDTYRGRTKDIAVYNEENTGRKNDVGTDFPSNNQRTNANEKTTKQGITDSSATRDKNGNLFPWLKGSGEQEPNWFQKNRRFGDPEDQVKLEQQTNNLPRRKISEKQDVDLANQMHQGAIEARHAREIFQIKESSDEAADRAKKRILRNAKEEQQQKKEQLRQQEIKKQQPVASNTDTSSSSNKVQEQSKPGLFSRIRDHFSPGKDDYGNYSDIKKAWKKSADSDDARIERFSSVAQSRKEAFDAANKDNKKYTKIKDDAARKEKMFNDFIRSERKMIKGNDKEYMQAYGKFLSDTKKKYGKLEKAHTRTSETRERFSKAIQNIKADEKLSAKDVARQWFGSTGAEDKKITLKDGKETTRSAQFIEKTTNRYRDLAKEELKAEQKRKKKEGQRKKKYMGNRPRVKSNPR